MKISQIWAIGNSHAGFEVILPVVFDVYTLKTGTPIDNGDSILKNFRMYFILIKSQTEVYLRTGSSLQQS